MLLLDSFAYPGVKAKSTWGRAMLEVDRRLSDKSLVSASINAASVGAAPAWGLSIGNRRAF